MSFKCDWLSGIKRCIFTFLSPFRRVIFNIVGKKSFTRRGILVMSGSSLDKLRGLSLYRWRIVVKVLHEPLKFGIDQSFPHKLLATGPRDEMVDQIFISFVHFNCKILLIVLKSHKKLGKIYSFSLVIKNFNRLGLSSPRSLLTLFCFSMMFLLLLFLKLSWFCILSFSDWQALTI